MPPWRPHDKSFEELNNMPCVALPISWARLKVNGFDQTKEVRADDVGVKFSVRLPKGSMRVETFFYDEDRDELCGAYYVVVQRLSE